jgi:tetratricopeptide (TPR) repeat protein
MGDTLPHVAMQKLDSIKPLFVNETEYMRKKLALLEIRLQDKAYITHTTDEPIKNICKFFEKNGTEIEKQEAFYYMGSVYRDLNDYPNAVTNFLNSASFAENNKNADKRLLQNTYSQLSYLLRIQLNYTGALDAALKQLDIAENNSTANERTYMNVASCYVSTKDTINAIKYYDLIMENIDKIVIDKSNSDIIAAAMGDYSLLGYKSEATICHDLLNRLNKEDLPFNYLVNLAIYYECFNNIDSAATARIELYDVTSRIESKYDAAQWLTRYYFLKKDYEKAAEFAIKFIEANWVVIDKRNLEHTTNAKNFFQYRRDKEEEAKVMQKAAKDKFHATLAISISIILLLGGALFHFWRKKQLLDVILSKEENIKKAKDLAAEKDIELAKEKSEVEQKERELSTLNTANSMLTKQLKDAEEDFKLLIAQNRELTKLMLMNDIEENAGDIIEKVKKTSKGKYHLNDEEWKELLGAIDKLYPEFTHEVQAKFKRISEPMLRVCYLLKIGMSAPEIVNLTDYPRQTVFDRIKRIEKVLNW